MDPLEPVDPHPAALTALPLPDVLGAAARSMAPAYLRRRLMNVGTPYADGKTTTFVYVGDALGVRIVQFMSLFPPIPPMTRLEGTDLWHVTVELPKKARIEYKIEIVTTDRTDRILDPLNRRTASDPFGSNSVAHGRKYVDPSWTTPGVDARVGEVQTIDIGATAFGDVRTLSVYLPHDFPHGGPYPAVFFHDGSDLLEYASVATVFDNLITSTAVPSFVGVLMDPVDRNREYVGNPAHARFVLDDLLPHVTTEFAVTSDPHGRILAGASLGAVAALDTALRAPGRFGSLILLSGSFVTALGGPFNRGPVFTPVVDFMTAYLADPQRPAYRAWMACGEYEALSGDNRRFVPILRATGMEVTYEETQDGHHWVNWRNNIGNALRDVVPTDRPESAEA